MFCGTREERRACSCTSSCNSAMLATAPGLSTMAAATPFAPLLVGHRHATAAIRPPPGCAQQHVLDLARGDVFAAADDRRRRRGRRGTDSPRRRGSRGRLVGNQPSASSWLPSVQVFAGDLRRRARTPGRRPRGPATLPSSSRQSGSRPRPACRAEPSRRLTCGIAAGRRQRGDRPGSARRWWSWSRCRPVGVGEVDLREQLHRLLDGGQRHLAAAAGQGAQRRQVRLFTGLDQIDDALQHGRRPGRRC